MRNEEAKTSNEGAELEAISTWLERPVVAAPESLGRSFASRRRSSVRRRTGTVLALVAVGLAAVIASWSSRPGAEREARPEPRPVATSATPPATDAATDSRHVIVVLTSGTKLYLPLSGTS